MVITVAIAARERALRVLAEREESEGTAHQLNGTVEGSVPGSDIPMRIRERYGQKLVVYGSTHTHSLGAKVRLSILAFTLGDTETPQAALLLGLQWREVPVRAKDDYSLRGDMLREVVEKDVANGLVPFFVSEW